MLLNHSLLSLFYLFAQLFPQEHLSPKQLLEYLVIFKQEKFTPGHGYIHSGGGGGDRTKQFFKTTFELISNAYIRLARLNNL